MVRAAMGVLDKVMVDHRQYLHDLKFIVIAVVTDDGKPWAVPVGIQKYNKGALEWFSKVDTVHSRAIAQNPQISLTAFTTKQDAQGEYGFYATAHARKQLGLPGGVALYKAEIEQAWYNDAQHIKTKIDREDI